MLVYQNCMLYGNTNINLMKGILNFKYYKNVSNKFILA